jgi:hypothetical protein
LRDESYVRPRLLCPACNRGCYHLLDKKGTSVCRKCSGYDYRCRHRNRSSPAFYRIAKLRKSLGADPDPMSPVKPNKSWRRLD